MAVNLQVVKQAQEDQNSVVADNGVTLLKSVDELVSIGGKVDYIVALRRIVNAYPAGVMLTKVQMVLPDSEELKIARKSLVDSSEIVEEPKKKSFILKLVTKKTAE